MTHSEAANKYVVSALYIVYSQVIPPNKVITAIQTVQIYCALLQLSKFSKLWIKYGSVLLFMIFYDIFMKLQATCCVTYTVCITFVTVTASSFVIMFLCFIL